MAKSCSNEPVVMTKPIDPDMEFAAVKFASVIAESMDFSDDQIEEIQLAMIETCINANEHIKSPDKPSISQYLIRTDVLEINITDLRE